MAIKTDCPRCKTRLLVPNESAGGYAHCPQCKGRFWVAKDAPADATPVVAIEIVSAPSVRAAGTASAPPAVSGGLPIRGVPGATVPLPPSSLASFLPTPAKNGPSARKPKKSSAMARVSPVAPPLAPIAHKKVARFISAEAADSTLQLAADGKLPELRLTEGSADEKPDAKSKSVNPLVMLGVLSLSVVLSVALVLLDVASPTVAGSQYKDSMRRKIEASYFGSESFENRALEPYQALLREAQRAYTRGDHKTERQDYRKVLEMLRAERGSYEKGLTGSRSRDKELENAISVLLSGG